MSAIVIPQATLDAYFAKLLAIPESTRPWYIREALHAASLGWIHPIPQRSNPALLLMRFWLSEPEPKADEDRWESGDSLLLHNLLLPDDTDALHSHPWPFRTTILSGGYVEYLPPTAWLGHPDQPGPPTDANRVVRGTGTTIDHGIHDLHAVGRVFDNTWTLVRTGDGGRDWGFHAPGKIWTKADTYLGRHPVADHHLAPQGVHA